MEAFAIMKNVPMSAQKMREVVRQIQGLPALEAQAVLQFVPRKGARLAAKNIAVAPISLQRAARILAAPKHPFAALHPIGVALGRWLASFGLDPQPYRRRAPGPNSPR